MGRPRPYTIDPQVAHERARKGGRARTTPDYHITRLEDVASDLTDEQARKLVGVLNFWAERTPSDLPEAS
jgi:hypothetical protein